MSNRIVVNNILILLCLLFFVNLTFGQEENENTQDQIKKLRQKVEELEKTVADLKRQQEAQVGQGEVAADTTEKSALEKELAKELGMEQPEAQATPDIQKGQVTQGTVSARRSSFQNMNPNISVVGTILGNVTSFESTDRNIDLNFDEGEFAFQAAVDPYAAADFFASFGRHEAAFPVPGVPDGQEESGGLEPEIEEAYITLLTLPFSTQAKAGKFRSRFGKINETHPHAYNFIGVPVMYSNFFSPEGLVDEGLGISWLLPNKAFFQELSLQVTSGPSEDASFTRADNNRLLYLAHLKNFFDLSDNTTLELGFSGLTGPNDAAGNVTNIAAADLTVKWKPLQRNRYKSFEFMNEFLVSHRKNDLENITSFGLYSFLRYQFAKRWFMGARYDYSEFPEFSEFHHQAFSGIVQFFATEFEKLEMQYTFNDGNFFDSFSEFQVRAVFVIGAHGAHQY